jgi:hypothetical protein
LRHFYISFFKVKSLQKKQKVGRLASWPVNWLTGKPANWLTSSPIWLRLVRVGVLVDGKQGDFCNL